MSQPDPSSRGRRAPGPAAALALLAVLLCAAGAPAQSGRKAQKPLGLPTEAPKQGESESKKPEAKKAEALVTFVVMKDDNLTMGLDTLTRDGVAAAFVNRLRQVTSVEITDAGKGRRQEARERARKEEAAFVVWFQLDDEAVGMSRQDVDARGLVLRTYVYTPKAGELKYTDTIYQRPYRDSARIGGVRVPVPTRRVGRYPSQYELEQAARDAADRLLTRFHITPPPEHE